jgi:hypothetical protein
MQATDALGAGGLEEYVLAYFLSTQAAQVNIDGRYRRREEFIQSFEDAFFYSTQQFGGAVAGRHARLCEQLVARLAETGCLAAVHDKWSGTSYQFDPGRYRSFVKDQIDSNAICQRAEQAGPQYWQEVFSPG